jgi:uncharacterized protein
MARRPWLVNVSALRRALGSRRREHLEGTLDTVETAAARVAEGAEVEADLTFEALNPQSVIVTGSISAPWQGTCRRCLGEATGTVSADVRELFEEDSDGEETYPLKGDQVDVEPMVRDAVLLDLPAAPLCREDCRGLCATCGANLNEAGDDHDHPEDRDPRWAALDQLKD